MTDTTPMMVFEQLLEAYKNAEQAVIGEYSHDFDKDFAELDKTCGEWRTEFTLACELAVNKSVEEVIRRFQELGLVTK